MRKFKFRAWSADIKQMMFYGTEVAIALNGSLHLASDDWYHTFNDQKGETIDWITIMQYIGIKDKNGKDVYESDIIIFDNSQIGGKRITGEVIFNTDQTLSNLEWGIWTKDGYHPTDFLGEIEIIGNIYQNPELK